jgi:hypothetical protein
MVEMVQEVSLGLKNTFLAHFKGLNGQSFLPCRKIIGLVFNFHQILGGSTCYGK